MKKIEYKILPLPDGGYIQIKYDIEGIVYDRFDKDNECVEAYGYDYYHEIKQIDQLKTTYNENKR